MSYNPIDDVEDEILSVNTETSTALKSYISKPIFMDLPGIDTADERERLARVFTDLLNRITLGIEAHPSKLWVMKEFQKSLEIVQEEDTEARDHFGIELENLMDILGIESSDGLLAAYLGGM